MIIVVKINRCLAAGGSLAACAYRAWRLSSLMTNPTLRNECKYLVAMNGYSVVGVFCIRGVAWDLIEPSRVQFDMTPASNECFHAVENMINQLNNITQKTRYIQGAGYIKINHFTMAGVQVTQLNCCDQGNIPLLEPHEIEQIQRPNL
jgi:uncharacterized membrane protein YedE/YeeE